MWIRSLDQEDPLEKGMATHPRIPAWAIPWTEEPGGLRVHKIFGHDLGNEHHTTASSKLCPQD